ncbi:hypothetical protein SRHO_G00183790 [Serrasalmus rhombeus]
MSGAGSEVINDLAYLRKFCHLTFTRLRLYEVAECHVLKDSLACSKSLSMCAGEGCPLQKRSPHKSSLSTS